MRILKRFKNKDYTVSVSNVPAHKLPTKEKEIEKMKLTNTSKIDLRDVTFMIPLRIESEDRKKCVSIVIDYLLKNFDTNIIVLEEGSSAFFPGIKKPNWENQVKYIFRRSNDPLFYKTLNINIMVKNTTTPIICAMDSDCIFHPFQYQRAVQKIRDKELDFCYPFDQPQHNITKEYIKTLESTLNLSSIHDKIKPKTILVPPGGCFFMNKSQFIKGGLENQHMISYGPEDTERRDRLMILGYKVGNVVGPLFHIDHSRTTNSNDHNPLFAKNTEEYNKIRFMSKQQLQQYITTWEWAK